MVVYVEVRGLGLEGDTSLLNMWHNSCGYDTTGACQCLDKLLYTPDCGSGCGLTAGGRNGTVTRNTATAEGLLDFQSLIQKRTGHSSCPKEKGEES